MVIKYGAAPKRFQSKWDTTQAGSANDTVVLPLRSDGSYNFRIDWGDGKSNRDDITTYNQSEVTHQYDDTGVYTIKIVGDIKGWYFNGGGDDDKIMEVSSWGPLILTLPDSFEGGSNLDSTATDKLVISTTNATRMFYQCFMGSGGNVNLWDISNITNMTQFFYGTRFDQPIGDWNVSSVTNMQNMFAGTTNVNTTIPFDQEKPFVTSGIRLGTPAATTRGFDETAFEEVAKIISLVLKDPENEKALAEGKERVKTLTSKHPLYN